MISDEERRDVARRLREWTWKSAPPECLLNQLVFSDDCPGTDDDPDTIDCHQCEVIAAKRLADLIEPTRTCSEPTRTCEECDRDALLALADEMVGFGDEIDRTIRRAGVFADSWESCARRIRKALRGGR